MEGLRKQFILLVAVVTVGITIAIAFNIEPYLLGPDEWRWNYARPGVPWRLLFLIGPLLIHLFTALQFNRTHLQTQRPPWYFLLLFVFSACLIQIGYLAINDDPIAQLFARTISANSSGVYSAGATISSPTDFLLNYPQIMPTLPVHPQRYPPGLALSFYYVRLLLEQIPFVSTPLAEKLRLYQCVDLLLMRSKDATIASAALQMALPLLSSLVLLPMFSLAQLVANRKTAIWCVVFYPIIPSFVLWTGRWDQFYPLLAVVCWWLLAKGLLSRRTVLPYVLLFLSGFVLFIGSFLSFGNLYLLVPLGLWAVFWLLKENQLLSRRTLALGTIFLLGLVAPWAGYQLRFGYGFVDILRVSMGFHLGLRTYSTWLFYHVYDFGLFLSIPLALGFGAAVMVALKNVRALSSATLFVLSFASGLLLLNVSGLAQGEVARVWLFLTPFAVISAVNFLVTYFSAKHRVLLLVLASCQLIVFGAFIRPITTDAMDLPTYDRQFAATAPAQTTAATLGDVIALQGFNLVAQDNLLEVDLYWKALKPMQNPYTIFIHLIDEAGNIVAQADSMPRQGGWPTTCWMADEYISDKHTLPLTLSPESADKLYTLYVGMYWLESGERLPTTGGQAVEADRIYINDMMLGVGN